jgi:PAS domain S-box-containing protein
MRRKIVLSLLILFIFFSTGAAVAVLYITNTSSELGHLITLHQIENLRRGLVISVQTVQSDLYSVHTPLAHKLDSIIHNVTRLEDSAEECSSCHHSPEITGRISTVQGLIQEYQTELSHYITASANKERIERIGLEAASIGNQILIQTEDMSLIASRHLGELTGKAMIKIKNVRTILFMTLISAFILGLAVSINLIKSITRPIQELVNATRIIASGSIGYETSFNDKSEFGELAKNFNIMSAALKEGYDNLETANIELQREVADRKRAEEKIEKAYKKTYNILEKSPFGIFVVNESGQVDYANPAMLELSCDEPEDFVGMNIFKSHAYGELGIDQKIKAALEGIPFHVGPVEYTGTRTMVRNFIGIPLDEEEERKVLIFVDDVTEREKLEEQLRHAQKMEAIGTLTGGLAHEFNNIMTAIIGSAELFLEEVEKDDPLREYPEIILSSALRAANLTQSLLAYSRKQITNKWMFSINAVINNVQRIISGIVSDDIKVEVTGADDDVMILADSNQIEQVLINLVTNACDAMPDGGTLTIQAGRVEIDDDFIRERGKGEPGEYALISVADTGAGVDEETQEKMFEPFFTTKDVGKGTGLGLSMVYGIVERHNGFIDILSKPGEGTTFGVYLPAVKATAEDAEIEEQSISTDGKETILLAEDDMRVRQLLKISLEKAGYGVIEAIDGEDAIKKFMKNSGAVELLLTDVIMPGKNGKEVYDEIVKAKADIKVIFMSGYADRLIHEKGISSDEKNFLSKPVARKKLLRRLREVLDSD